MHSCRNILCSNKGSAELCPNASQLLLVPFDIPFQVIRNRGRKLPVTCPVPSHSGIFISRPPFPLQSPLQPILLQRPRRPRGPPLPPLRPLRLSGPPIRPRRPETREAAQFIQQPKSNHQDMDRSSMHPPARAPDLGIPTLTQSQVPKRPFRFGSSQGSADVSFAGTVFGGRTLFSHPPNLFFNPSLFFQPFTLSI